MKMPRLTNALDSITKSRISLLNTLGFILCGDSCSMYHCRIKLNATKSMMLLYKAILHYS